MATKKRTTKRKVKPACKLAGKLLKKRKLSKAGKVLGSKKCRSRKRK